MFSQEQDHGPHFKMYFKGEAFVSVCGTDQGGLDRAGFEILGSFEVADGFKVRFVAAVLALMEMAVQPFPSFTT